jgi:hypothetical protein
MGGIPEPQAMGVESNHPLRKLRDVPSLRHSAFEGKAGKCICSKQSCDFARAA